jgi:hypothetical protein
MGKLLLGAVGAALLISSPASATRVEWYAGHSVSGDTVTLVDRAGVANALRVAARGRTRVRELGRATLSAGWGCLQAATRLVTCRRSEEVWFRLNAGDDRMRITGRLAVQGRGGPGADRVNLTGNAYAWLDFGGGKGRDVLRGGRRRDDLNGGEGRDVVAGRGGWDTLYGSRSRRVVDVLRGGPGMDAAGWLGRGLRANLARGRVRGDELHSIEGLLGTKGDDRLTGTDGDNLLYGQGGSDLLVGGAGDDVLGAGDGFGGSDGARDRVRCGPGRDLVRHPGRDPLGVDCERFTFDYSNTRLPAQPRERGRRRLAVKVLCGRGLRCTRRVTLTSRGRLLGRSRVRRSRGVDGYWMPVRLRRQLPTAPTTIAVTGRDGRYAYRLAWRIRR